MGFILTGDGSFKDTKEEPHSHGTGKILRGSHAAEDQTPHDDIEGAPFPEGQPLQQAVGWVLPEEVSEVEHGTDPAVLVTGQPDICFQAHNRSIGHGGLVEVVEAVDQAQQGHEVPVDLPQQLALVLRGELDDLAVLALEDLEGLVGIVAVGVLEDRAGFLVSAGRDGAVLGGLLDVRHDGVLSEAREVDGERR